MKVKESERRTEEERKFSRKGVNGGKKCEICRSEGKKQTRRGIVVSIYLSELQKYHFKVRV